RCRCHDARASRYLVQQGRRAVRLLSVGVCSLAIAVMLAGCNDRDPSHQGWIEANLIFVGPDEAGRVEELSVREGDHVEKGAPLFKVDSDLQQADVASLKATLLNAQQTFDRADRLLKSAAGTQKDFDAAQSVLRDTQA